MGDGLPRPVQVCGAGGAVVIDVVDGDARHTELVGPVGVAVAVVGGAFVDGVVL